MWKIIRGDCEQVLQRFRSESFDALITDPPYGMGDVYNLKGLLRAWMRWDSGMEYVSPGGFMHHEWDKCVPPPFIWAEIMDKMKPGAHGLVFASARTHGLMDISLRLAGFEIIDSIDWIFSSGFSKSRNISKDLTGKDVELAKGLGTALKPAHEPILFIRRPLSENSYAAQWKKTKTGVINIKKCLTPLSRHDKPRKRKNSYTIGGKYGIYGGGKAIETGLNEDGRLPTNLVFSHLPECEPRNCKPGCPVLELMFRQKFYPTFRYIPKASKAEKEAGLEKLPTLMFHRVNPGGLEHDAKWAPVERKNPHPTVKPISLLEWLCDLIVPENGRILDPFIGSGSTGCAAVRKGINFLGIEKDERYAEIARARIKFCERMVT